ncbi:MAG: carbohydrate kinase, partial [Firmicutes bacterium]|nr:carbohydrate kinase [Bacillota bacterium]
SLSGADPERFNCFAELETAGKCLEWAKKQVGIDGADGYGEMMDRMKDVPAGSNGVMFTPWLHDNRNPFEDPDARGMFFNLGLESTAEDMIHAVIEGVCLHLRWQMTAMTKLTPPSEVIRFVGGGTQAPLTCQILADVLGRKVETVDSPQNAGSVGAAAVMAVGLGIFEDLQETKASVPAVAMYEPRKENTAVYDSLFETFKDLYKCNKKNFHKLNERSSS